LDSVRDSDEQCKHLMALCDRRMTATVMARHHEQLSQLNGRLSRCIADIMRSKNVVHWDPGPNTNPGYVTVLYGDFQARAGFYQVSLAEVDNDKTLFNSLRAKYMERQNIVRVVLAPFAWFGVKRLEYVKVRVFGSTLRILVDISSTKFKEIQLLLMSRSARHLFSRCYQSRDGFTRGIIQIVLADVTTNASKN
jgi:hypothetical protein